jgi:subtilisin family serine protease
VIGHRQRVLPGALLALALTLVLPTLLDAGQDEISSSDSVGATAEAIGAEAAGQILVTFEQRPARRMPRAGSSPKGYGGARSYQASPRSKRTASKLARDYDLREVDAWPIEALEVHCVVYEIPEGRSAEEMVTLLEQDPRVEMAQPMRIFEVLADGGAAAHSYNDPYFELQHGIRSMQVEEAHSWARGAGVRVAVVDTGVDLHHPELEGRVIAVENFVEKRSKSFATDVHGTAVAGVIASAAGNGIGIVGVAPGVKLMALKACWPETREAVSASCTSFSLAKALAFAIRKNADVLNMSLGGPADPLLARLIDKAVENGMVVVGAVGGDPSLSFPSGLDGVIGVRAAGSPAAGGRLPVVASEASLPAPGVDVLTLFPNGAFDFLSGSSLAAAHVAGVVALMLERQPRLAGDRIAALLQDTVVAADLINACSALSELATGDACREIVVAPTVGSSVSAAN